MKPMKRLTSATILTILATLVLSSSCGTTDDNPELSSTDAAGRVSETALTAHILRVRKAAATYRSLNGSYPTTVSELVDAGHLHPGQELDPWGTPFALSVDGSTLVVTSYGADKKPGGEGENRDRVSRGVGLQ